MADRVAEIRSLERVKEIRDLEAKKSANADPGTAAMGFPDGPTSAAEESPGVIGRAKQGVGATAKLLDAPRAATGGPALALALKALTGKDAASLQEFSDGLNPTNLKQFPHSDEMFDRVGVPKGARMSDAIPGYGEPGNSPWYQPEKGGKLDFTARGAGGFLSDVATDPLTYLSFGASAAAKKALAESATSTALEQAAKESASPTAKALSMVGDQAANLGAKVPGVAQIGQGSEALANLADKSVVGRLASKLATGPSDMVSGLGEKMYKAPISSVEHEGVKYGKDGVADALYQAGVKSPIGMRQTTGKAASTLLGARDKIYQAADAAGATTNVDRALSNAKEMAAEIRANKIPAEQHIADQLEQQIAEHEAMVAGTPGTAAQTIEQPTGKLNWKGEPIMETITNPGKDAVPGMVLPASRSERIKRSLTDLISDAAYNQTAKTPVSAKSILPLANGFRSEGPLAVAEKLGPKAGQDVAELNSSAGKLIGTKKSQVAVQNANERLANNLTGLSGTDAFLPALAHSPEDGVMNLLQKKGMDALRLSVMPTGYALQKLGKGRLTAPVLDNYVRRKYINANQPGGQDGQN